MDAYEKNIGLVFDNRYKIEQVIGMGGMAVVYKAFDLLMKRYVAVKLLRDDIASDTQSVKRFINESKAVAMLSHPNIVNIYDVSVRENAKYIVMEYIEGITLKKYMTRRGVLSLREIISYTEQILHALRHAHSKGIVHRDIKPQNIMLLKNGIIKVMDFGIAKLPNAETVTMTDKAIGTVFYISPEQVMGKPIDARSDLYSLGAMMYEMATGTLPFNADTPVAVAMMQVNDEPKPPQSIVPALPTGLVQIIERAMTKEPDERYASADEMLAQVTRLRENPKVIFKQPERKKRKDDDLAPRRTTMLPIILGVTLAFMIAAGIAGFYVLNTILFNDSLDETQTETIPKFTGSVYSEQLKILLEESKLYRVSVKNVYDAEAEAGIIIAQEPKEGETRKVIPGKQFADITLVVSSGAEVVPMPDVTSLEYRTVQAALRELGLNPKIISEYHDTFGDGTVIRTEPTAGTILAVGETVNLYVSKGAEIRRVTVSNYVGLDEGEAIKEIIANKLTVGEVEYIVSNKEMGLIVEQSLSPFTDAEEYSAIDFKVSGGPDGIQPGQELPVDTEPDETTSADGMDTDTTPDTTDEGGSSVVHATPPETEPPETDAGRPAVVVGGN